MTHVDPAESLRAVLADSLTEEALVEEWEDYGEGGRYTGTRFVSSQAVDVGEAAVMEWLRLHETSTVSALLEAYDASVETRREAESARLEAEVQFRAEEAAGEAARLEQRRSMAARERQRSMPRLGRR